MNICIIRNAEAEITTSFYRIVDAVIESGNTPVILSRNRECEKIEVKKKVYKFKDVDIDNYEINIPAKRGAGMKNIFQLAVYQWILLRWLKKNKNKYDMVHSFDFDAGLPCSRINKKLGFKHVYHIADFYTASRNMPGKLKKIFRQMEIDVIDKSDYTIICNEERFDQIEGCSQKKIEVVHNVPVLSDEINEYIKNHVAKEKDETIRLCYVGKLSKNRFIPEVVETVSEMKNVKLDIAGVGPVEDMVSEAADKYENITYHGKMKYEDALKLYLECDLMFAIYDPAVANHRYSAPNKIYEAMILKKPIIVAENTGMDKIVKANDMGVVINYNVDEFKSALKKLLSNREEMAKMGINAGNAYEEYCWERMRGRLVKIYDKLK